MKNFVVALLACFLSGVAVSDENVATFVGEGTALSGDTVKGRCIEYKEASTTDKVVGTAAGAAVGGGLGAMAGKALGGKTGALVGGLVGSGVGAGTGNSAASERTCVVRENTAYEYMVKMKDNTLIKVTQTAHISLRKGNWSHDQHPKLVNVYRFSNGVYVITEIVK